MKKRYLIIPLATIAVSLCLAMFMTFFTTPAYSLITDAGEVLMAASEDGETHEDYFRPAKKAGKVLQLSYKISPKFETLEMLNATYNPFLYIYPLPAYQFHSCRCIARAGGCRRWRPHGIPMQMRPTCPSA